jgi:mono/diheme cytochrome c family protein
MADVVMHSTQFMTGADLSAIATYLTSLPGSGAAPAAPSVEPRILDAGMAIYRDNCAGCHGAHGQGAPELIPTLPGDGAVVGADPISMLHLILRGGTANHTQAAPSDPGMPAFDWKLTDAQVAALATFLRASWGNRASPVSAGTVADLRKTLSEDGTD